MLFKKTVMCVIVSAMISFPVDARKRGQPCPQQKKTTPKKEEITHHPFFDQFINAGDLVFDVGANIGKKTEQYLAHHARVICFDPQPVCVGILQSKFSTNASVIIVDKGIADTEGTLELALCAQANTLATFSEEEQTKSRFAQHNYYWPSKITVQVTTLDRVIEQYGLPKFCKIDVENFEYEVLKGLTKPIPYISFEYHIEFFEKIRKCILHLMSIGYTKFNFTVGEQLRFASTQWFSGPDLLQAIDGMAHQKNWDHIWGLWGDIYAFHPQPYQEKS